MNKEINGEMINIPEHVAIIMDGNGRWAERRGLPNRKNTPDAMVALTEDKNVALMEELVLNT